LYRAFLETAPDHKYAGRAARLAIKILEARGENDDARALAATHAAVLSETVPVGINASFLDASADAARFVGRFESESREIFKHRQKIAEVVNLHAGQAVADIGAGTGFFSNLFARTVGDSGKVYAVELSPVLAERLRELAKTMKLPQVEVVQCTERSVMLPHNSVDVAFICDTYHHFAFQDETLASLHRAMRPGGQLLLIDFERIPGKSSDFVLGHVRAGREVFRAEIEAAGFRFVRAEDSSFLADNYFLRFEKK